MAAEPGCAMSPLRPLMPLLALSLGALASLGALEAIFRIWVPSPHAIAPRVDTFEFDAAHPTPRPKGASPRRPFSTMISTYSDDPRGYFDPGAQIAHTQNSKGYRDEEHPLPKPAGTFRILGLGDSYLWGQGVRRGDRCLDRMGTVLSEEGRTHAIETINLAVSGSSSEDHLMILEREGLAYDPDLVILHFVLNDIVSRDVDALNLEFGYSDLAEIESHLRTPGPSALWNWAKHRYHLQAAARKHIAQTLEGFDEHHMDWQISQEAIARMAQACKERGVPFVVVVFPYFYHLQGDYPFQPVHDAIATSLTSMNIPFLDLRHAFPGYDGPELWVHATDQHPNELGHQLAAAAILEHLDSKGLLPSAPP